MKTTTRRRASSGFVLLPGHTLGSCGAAVRYLNLPALSVMKCGASVSWDGTGVPLCERCRKGWGVRDGVDVLGLW